MSELNGLLLKGYGSFYTVKTDIGVIEARARGRLKMDNVKLLIGDRVVLEKEQDTYAITGVMERKNSLIRPAVANVDQIIVVIAKAEPAPNFKQIDKLLCFLEYNNLDVSICINKADLDCGEDIAGVYEKAGYKVVVLSALEQNGGNELSELLNGKVSAFAGCSGVGKSSLINMLDNGFNRLTGEVGKIKRGKHTTTHASLLELECGGFIADTPGFSVVDLSVVPKEELYTCFPEFRDEGEACRFVGCTHTSEPGCRIKELLEDGSISRSRYESYLAFYDELSQIKKYD